MNDYINPTRCADPERYIYRIVPRKRLRSAQRVQRAVGGIFAGSVCLFASACFMTHLIG